jgi:hypothetical protein
MVDEDDLDEPLREQLDMLRAQLGVQNVRCWV